MSVENSVGQEYLTDVTPPAANQTSDPQPVRQPVPLELPSTVPGEPGGWLLLLVPVAICLGLLVFSAVFEQF